MGTTCWRQTRCPTGLELALGHGAEPADGRSTPPSSAPTQGSTARSRRSSRAGRCSSSWLADPVAIDFEQVLRRELTLVGSCSATPAAMGSGFLLPVLDPIPTVTLPLERFAEGLELYRSHEALKVVFTP